MVFFISSKRHGQYQVPQLTLDSKLKELEKVASATFNIKKSDLDLSFRVAGGPRHYSLFGSRRSEKLRSFGIRDNTVFHAEQIGRPKGGSELTLIFHHISAGSKEVKVHANQRLSKIMEKELDHTADEEEGLDVYLVSEVLDPTTKISITKYIDLERDCTVAYLHLYDGDELFVGVIPGSSDDGDEFE